MASTTRLVEVTARCTAALAGRVAELACDLSCRLRLADGDGGDCTLAPSFDEPGAVRIVGAGGGWRVGSVYSSDTDSTPVTWGSAPLGCSLWRAGWGVVDQMPRFARHVWWAGVRLPGDQAAAAGPRRITPAHAGNAGGLSVPPCASRNASARPGPGRGRSPSSGALAEADPVPLTAFAPGWGTRPWWWAVRRERRGRGVVAHGCRHSEIGHPDHSLPADGFVIVRTGLAVGDVVPLEGLASALRR